MKYNLGYLLSKASRQTKWELNQQLSTIGLTSSQWAVIKDVSIQENNNNIYITLTSASIAERLNSDRPTMSGIIHRLIKYGWIYREDNPEDKRSHIIRLTSKSKELLPQLEEVSDATIEKAMKGFSDKELIQFREYLNRVLDNLC